MTPSRRPSECRSGRASTTSPMASGGARATSRSSPRPWTASRTTSFHPAARRPSLTCTTPAVTSKISTRRSMAAGEVEFMRKHTGSKIIVAIPSPYTVGRRMWSADHSTGPYPTREEFVEACVPIINEELLRLAALGVDMIQIDDPWLGLLVDPTYRENEGITDIDHEIELSVQSMNRAVAGLEEVPLSVHFCHAHFNRQHGTKGPYDLIIGALGRDERPAIRHGARHARRGRYRRPQGLPEG